MLISGMLVSVQQWSNSHQDEKRGGVIPVATTSQPFQRQGRQERPRHGHEVGRWRIDGQHHQRVHHINPQCKRDGRERREGGWQRHVAIVGSIWDYVKRQLSGNYLYWPRYCASVRFNGLNGERGRGMVRFLFKPVTL